MHTSLATRNPVAQLFFLPVAALETPVSTILDTLKHTLRNPLDHTTSRLEGGEE